MGDTTDDIEAGDGTIDIVLGLVCIIFFTILAAYNMQENIRAAYGRLSSSENIDKIEIDYDIPPYAYEFTGYQTYMFGFLMDNYGAADRSGIAFENNGSTLELSPESFGYNYTRRNSMITSHSGSSVYTTILASGHTGVDLVTHFRGLESERYKLELCDRIAVAEDVMTPDGTHVLEADRKEYKWTLYGHP